MSNITDFHSIQKIPVILFFSLTVEHYFSEMFCWQTVFIFGSMESDVFFLKETCVSTSQWYCVGSFLINFINLSVSMVSTKLEVWWFSNNFPKEIFSWNWVPHQKNSNFKKVLWHFDWLANYDLFKRNFQLQTTANIVIYKEKCLKISHRLSRWLELTLFFM